MSNIHSSLSVISRLHLCKATIHKQLRSRDVVAVIGGEKRHGLRDLIGCAEPAQRNTAGNGLHAFLCRFCGMPWSRVGKARAHRVHANRSEEHTSELQSLRHLVCRLLLSKKKTQSMFLP